MYKTVLYVRKEEHPEDPNAVIFKYQIIDTDELKNDQLILTLSKDWLVDTVPSSLLPSGLIAFYKQRNTIPKNLALFYINGFYNSWEELIYMMEEDRDKTDKFFPYLEYGIKYYDCVLAQVRKLRYVKGKKFRNEQPINRDILFEDW